LFGFCRNHSISFWSILAVLNPSKTFNAERERLNLSKYLVCKRFSLFTRGNAFEQMCNKDSSLSKRPISRE